LLRNLNLFAFNRFQKQPENFQRHRAVDAVWRSCESQIVRKQAAVGDKRHACHREARIAQEERRLRHVRVLLIDT
jgi:hypothetical protein